MEASVANMSQVHYDARLKKKVTLKAEASGNERPQVSLLFPKLVCVTGRKKERNPASLLGSASTDRRRADFLK